MKDVRVFVSPFVAGESDVRHYFRLAGARAPVAFFLAVLRFDAAAVFDVTRLDRTRLDLAPRAVALPDDFATFFVGRFFAGLAAVLFDRV